MKFSIGDKIIMKQTDEEGVVSAYIDKEMIEVNIGGTKIPVFIDDIEHPYLRWFMQKKSAKSSSQKLDVTNIPVEKQSTLNKESKGYYLSFLPEFVNDGFDDVLNNIKIYFLNETINAVTIQYNCSLKIGSVFSIKASVTPFQKFYLHDINLDILNKIPKFEWKITETNADKAIIDDSIRMKPAKFFDYLRIIKEKNEPTFSIQLSSYAELSKLKTENENARKELDLSVLKKITDSKVQPKTNISNDTNFTPASPVYEIDLHIEKLVNGFSKMSNYEMLTIQLETLEKAIANAIQCGQNYITVIHGVGTGKLKEEVHQKLNEYTQINYYVSDWMPQYGNGATQVFFK